MEALIELCDLIAQNPTQFTDKLAWICSRCPPPDSLLSGSPRVSRSQLNAVLAIARFLSKCPNIPDQRPKAVVLEFIQSVPTSFRKSFWPQSYGGDLISSFYVDFLGYLSKVTDLSSDFATEIAEFMGEVVISAIGIRDDGVGISRLFLTALSQHFPPILPSDANKLVNSLLDQYLTVAVPMSPRELVRVAASETSSSQSSPIGVNSYRANEPSSPGNEASHVSGSSSSATTRVADDATSASSRGSVMMNGGSKSSVDQLYGNVGVNDGGDAGAMFRQQVASFEEESVESLERQEIALNLIGHVLDKVRIDPRLVEQIRLIAKKQLQSISFFLKMRKRDWPEQGPLLKARINTKLSVYQAAVRPLIKSHIT